MSDHDPPPPGVHPAAWTRWRERRGEPVPLLRPPGPGAAPAGDDPAPEAAAAAPPTALDDLRARLRAARSGDRPSTEIAVDVDQLAALLARADRLTTALARYAQHAIHCAARGGGDRCTCGLAEELAER